MTRKEVWQKVQAPAPDRWVTTKLGDGVWQRLFWGDVQLRFVWDTSDAKPYMEDWATSHGKAWRLSFRLMYGASLVAVIWGVFVSNEGNGGMDGGAVVLPCPRPGTRSVPRRIYEVVKDHFAPEKDMERYFEEFGLVLEDDTGFDDQYGYDEDDDEVVGRYEQEGGFRHESCAGPQSGEQKPRMGG